MTTRGGNQPRRPDSKKASVRVKAVRQVGADQEKVGHLNTFVYVQEAAIK
jgi:hypothetical protein